MAKTLYILRHAKSVQNADTDDDHERPINKRGEKSCVTMGNYIKEQNLVPEQILCSTALRAKQTINNIMQTVGIDTPIEYKKSLYMAMPLEVLEEVKEVGDETNKLMIVFHNPGAHKLALSLIGDGVPRYIQHINSEYPTCALAAITFDISSWKDISKNSGHLDDFVTPKIL